MLTSSKVNGVFSCHLAEIISVEDEDVNRILRQKSPGCTIQGLCHFGLIARKKTPTYSCPISVVLVIYSLVFIPN